MHLCFKLQIEYLYHMCNAIFYVNVQSMHVITLVSIGFQLPLILHTAFHVAKNYRQILYIVHCLLSIPQCQLSQAMLTRGKPTLLISPRQHSSKGLQMTMRARRRKQQKGAKLIMLACIAVAVI